MKEYLCTCTCTVCELKQFYKTNNLCTIVILYTLCLIEDEQWYVVGVHVCVTHCHVVGVYVCVTHCHATVHIQHTLLILNNTKAIYHVLYMI